MKIEFRYYLHDDHTSRERMDLIEEQTGYTIEEDLAEKIGRPFHEVTLHCVLDTETGRIEIVRVE